MLNQCTKFEVSRFTRYEVMNGSVKMQKMGWFGVIRGQSRSRAMPPFDRAHTTSYSTLIETTCMFIFYRFRDIAGYLSKVADFDPPHLHLAPPQGVIPVAFHRDLWHQKTRVFGV